MDMFYGQVTIIGLKQWNIYVKTSDKCLILEVELLPFKYGRCVFVGCLPGW